MIVYCKMMLEKQSQNSVPFITENYIYIMNMAKGTTVQN